MTVQIINEAKKIVAEVAPILAAKHGLALPTINYRTSARMTRAWGRASVKFDRATGKPMYTMTLSSHVYDGKTDCTSFRNTVVHELAHLAEYALYRRMSGHGYYWAKLMNDMGHVANARVTKAEVAETGHVAAPKRKMTKYAHHCNCKIHYVGGQIHNKLLRGHIYTCRRCGSHLNASCISVAKM